MRLQAPLFHRCTLPRAVAIKSCSMQAPPGSMPMPQTWRSLGVGSRELRLEFTLPTGQSFRWRQTGDGTYTGVIGTRVVEMRQDLDDVLYRVLARGEDAATGIATSSEISNEHDRLDAAAVREYFNLTSNGGLGACIASTCSSSSGSSGSGGSSARSLAQLAEHWSSRDPRFASISPFFPGARMLRQDPAECLFQFICSSNNHISRIHGMVERLCSAYGQPIPIPVTICASNGTEPAAASSDQSESSAVPAALAVQELAVQEEEEQGAPTPQLVTPQQPDRGADKDGAPPPARRKTRRGAVGAAFSPATPSAPSAGASTSAAKSAAGPAGLSWYAFPTLDQLAAATEEELRAAGFGYRAKYITGTVAALRAKDGGGHAWLLALRQQTYKQAAEELCTLPGIGPKVAACVCLFSLDKHVAIPVDTHVWQIATRYYLPHLRGKALTKKVHDDVQRAFEERFGSFAGWAHNTLFISELASQRERLPAALRPPGAAKQAKGRKAIDEEAEALDGEGEQAAAAKRRR